MTPGFPWPATLLGGVLGVLLFGLSWLFPPGLRLSFEGALVGVIGAVYVGFGLASPGGRSTGQVFLVANPQSAVVETVGAVAMLVLATLGAARAPWLLVLALVLHALWDIAHHGGRITPSVPGWYPPFCAAGDLALAGLIAATL